MAWANEVEKRKLAAREEPFAFTEAERNGLRVRSGSDFRCSGWMATLFSFSFLEVPITATFIVSPFLPADTPAFTRSGIRDFRN